MTRNHLQGIADDQSRLDAIANLLEVQLECSLRTAQKMQIIIETSERISSEIAEMGSNLDQQLTEIQEDFSSAAKQLASLNIALIKDETRRPHEKTSSGGTIAGDKPSSCKPEHAEPDYVKTRALDNTIRFNDYDPDDPPYNNPWDSFIRPRLLAPPEHFKSIQQERVYRQNARDFGGWDAFVFRVTRGYEP
jgi:hypothetical protein